MIGDKKEVFFQDWCYRCKHWSKDENEEPCDECLSEPGNEDSHKPTEWEASEK